MDIQFSRDSIPRLRLTMKLLGNLNGPEYEERYDYMSIALLPSPHLPLRLKRPFVPPTITLKEVHDAVPKHLFKSTHISL